MNQRTSLISLPRARSALQRLTAELQATELAKAEAAQSGTELTFADPLVNWSTSGIAGLGNSNPQVGLPYVGDCWSIEDNQTRTQETERLSEIHQLQKARWMCSLQHLCLVPKMPLICPLARVPPKSRFEISLCGSQPTTFLGVEQPEPTTGLHGLLRPGMHGLGLSDGHCERAHR